jgi:site-specific recombinase XerD
MHRTMLMTLYATGLRRAERGALLVDLGFCANRKHIVA